MKNNDYVLNLENYLIDLNADNLTVAIHRVGDGVSYECAYSAINHLSADALILYMHFMQSAKDKDCVLDFGKLLRSAPMCGELLQFALVELLVEGYFTYEVPDKDNPITTFEFLEHPDMDMFAA